MRKVPDVVLIVDQKREYNAILECQRLDIPMISLLDTNCDPDYADIPIPANDDAIRSIKLIVGRLADAIYEGRHGQAEYDEMEEYDYDSEEYDTSDSDFDESEYADESDDDDDN